MNLRTVLHLLVLSTGILAAVRGSVLASEDQPLRYGRIGTEGVSVFNLADDKGKEVARPAKGQLVAVYKEHQAGWLEIEVPGGYAVWVFGSYLKPTDQSGVYEVTANAVNLRPAPSNDVTNFPLPQRLQAGDKVRAIEPLDPAKPLTETWMRIWSPSGVHACVKSSAVEPLTAGEDGSALWKEALKTLPAAPLARAGAPRPSEPSEGERRESEARAALEEARAELERERAKETPDYAAVESALNAVVARGGAVAVEARAELRNVSLLREAAALKADLEREKSRRSEETLRAQQDVWDRSREKDPLGTVFTARGVVERRTGTDGVSHFFLRFGGETNCELLCSSGRYDLSTFAGVEVGVHGLQAASRTTEVPTYEVNRLEVIAVR